MPPPGRRRLERDDQRLHLSHLDGDVLERGRARAVNDHRNSLIFRVENWCELRPTAAARTMQPITMGPRWR